MQRARAFVPLYGPVTGRGLPVGRDNVPALDNGNWNSSRGVWAEPCGIHPLCSPALLLQVWLLFEPQHSVKEIAVQKEHLEVPVLS